MKRLLVIFTLPMAAFALTGCGGTGSGGPGKTFPIPPSDNQVKIVELRDGQHNLIDCAIIRNYLGTGIDCWKTDS